MLEDGMLKKYRKVKRRMTDEKGTGGRKRPK
jgi:hypothetical protein